MKPFYLFGWVLLAVWGTPIRGTSLVRVGGFDTEGTCQRAAEKLQSVDRPWGTDKIYAWCVQVDAY